MTIAFWAVFYSIFIPVVLAGSAKGFGPGYNNRTPRVSYQNF